MVSVEKGNELEGKILYHGPPEEARETKEFVNELLQRKIIELRPAQSGGKIKVCAGNKNGFSILGNKEMRISPNSRDYRIKYVKRPVEGENIKIDFVDLLRGRIAFSYKNHDIMLFRDYIDG